MKENIFFSFPPKNVKETTKTGAYQQPSSHHNLSIHPDMSDENIIDILSIHKQIQFYQNRASMGGEKDDKNFFFYLTYALPLLTWYETILKTHGKIDFLQTLKSPSSTLPPESIRITDTRPHTTSCDESLAQPPHDEKDDVCSVFPFFEKQHENMPENTMGIWSCIHNYLSFVKKYFPEMYHELGIDTLYNERPFPPKHGHHGDDTKKTHEKTISLQEHMNHPLVSEKTFTPYHHETHKECSSHDMVVSHDNMYVCGSCGYILEQDTMASNSVSFKDIHRVNLVSKYLYDRITHFKDCINQFQGKQNSTIDQKVYDDLLEQFLSHNLIPVGYMSMPKEIAFQEITKEHIMLFLKECRHTKHYEDVVLIHSHFTGAPVPDITHLENQLLHDFELLTTLYDKKYRHQDRKNFINTQYVLYQLLKRHKYPCRKEDFNILKTIDRKFYHDNICKNLFEELGWNFNPTF